MDATAVDYFGIDGAEKLSNEPKRPETGVRFTPGVTLTMTPLQYDLGYEPWPYTVTISAEEAKKIRDALNALDL